MRVFTIPAAYRRNLECAIAHELNEIARDIVARARGGEVLPGFVVDEEKTGTATIMINVVETRDETTIITIDGVTIHAIPPMERPRKIRPRLERAS